MSFGEPRRSKIPFAEVRASKAFMTEAQLLLVREMVRRSGEFVSEGSNQTFYHGRDWTYQREERDGYTTQVGHLELHQQKVTVNMDRLLANDMMVLPELILGFGEQASASLAERIESELTAVAEETGNTFAVPQDSSMVDAYLQALERGQWTIDAKGILRAPRILPDAKSQLRFIKEMSEKSEAFQKRSEEIRVQKEPLARQAEVDRLKKYDSER